jgi:acetylornithine deacetylase
MDEVIHLLEQLVRVESINPDLVESGAGEAPIARFVSDWAKHTGLEVIEQDAAPERPNVIIRAPGSGGGRSLMFNAHLDTVGIDGMANPLMPRIENGRMYGRGTYDMKASLAAILIAARNAKDMNLRGDVFVSAVADEEYASIGTEAVLREWSRWTADAVVVTEPTEMQVCIAHKGFVWLDVETHGKAAHGSRPNLGIDAITKMGHVLTELDQLNQLLQASPTHPYLGSGSLHASVISGGQGWSAYPAHCHLQLERRTIPGETPEIVQEQVQKILNQLAAGDQDFQGEVRLNLQRPPFSVDPDAEIVRTLRDAVTHVTGSEASLAGNTFWMDAAMFMEAGIPTVVFGPHGDGAHADVEWVDLDSVRQCVDIYTALIERFCA